MIDITTAGEGPWDDQGLPVLGRLLDAHKDILKTLREVRARHGDVVWFRIGPIKTLALLSADALEFGLRNKEGAMSNRLGWERYLDHVFPGAILAMDGAEHLRHRRIMQEAFTSAALRGYVEQMSPTIRDTVDNWTRGKRRVKAYPMVKQLTLDIAARTFMGIDAGRAADKINKAFIDAVEASIALMRLPLPPLPYYKGIKGQAYLVKEFQKILPEKQARQLPDLFSKLCHVVTEDGQRFTDAEILNHMVFVMMAAHDTSTSTLATLFYYLAKHPDWQQRLREQAQQMSELPDMEELEAMDEMTWVIHEALRMHPPLAVMPRVTTKTVTFQNYRLHEGILIGLAPILVHRDPQYWKNPDLFDPERFGPEREEHKGHKFAFTPFGGGAHLCIGKRFGMLEIRATLHQALRKYRWSVPDTYTMPYQFVPIAKPKDGLPIKLQRL